MAVITHVSRLEKKRNPTDLILREKNLQFGKPIKESRQDPLNRSHRAISSHGAEAPHLIHQVVGELFHCLFGFLRVSEKRAGPFARTLEIYMNADRHVQIERCSPETIVFLERMQFPAGKSLEQNGLEARLGAVFHL